MTGLRLAGFGAAMFAAGLALRAQAPPTDWRGFSEQVVAGIWLRSEIDAVADRQLRMTRANLAPGGHVPWHSHRGDPTVVYVLAGVLTNHHDDGTVVDYRAGDAFAEFGVRQHWIENRGTAPLVYIAANLHRRD